MRIQAGTSTNIVPFGKHKGEPVESLLADPGYLDWLVSQPWVKDRFPAFYQVVINYGGEPQDSPEHNEMQALFLDDERCFTLARRLYPRRTYGQDGVKAEKSIIELITRFQPHLEYRWSAPEIWDRRFEDQGWDVTFGIEPTSLYISVTSLPPCTCGACDHSNCSESAPCHGGGGYCSHSDHERRRSVPDRNASSIQAQQFVLWESQLHCTKSCPWNREVGASWLLRNHDHERSITPEWKGRIRVELKPDLGDDFPAVLRQVLRYPIEGWDRRCVVVRRHQFTTVTWDQVHQMFAASNVALIDESDIISKEVPF